MTYLCTFYAVSITIAAGWILAKNAKLYDENEFLSARYKQLSTEIQELRDAIMLQSIERKTEGFSGAKSFSLDDD